MTTPTPTLSRRRFIQGTLASGAALSLSPRLAFASADHATGDTLVLVMLRGGLDGLSALVPLADGAAYYAPRRQIGVPEGATLPVDHRFGLHPGLAALHELYVDGIVAFVPATGSTDPSRSHFDQQRVLDQGSTTRTAHSAGWLSRHLSSRASQPLQAMAAGTRVPGVLHRAPSAVAVPSSLDWTIDRLRRTADLAAGGSLLRALSGDRAVGAAAATSADAAATLLSVPPERRASSAYPNDPAARSLHDVARLLTAGIGLDAAVVDIGGWDMHATMGSARAGAMRRRLEVLGGALGAFHAETAGLARPVTTVVVSEFGRALAVNSSGGTDHGRGGLLFAVGRGIRGGVYGAWPGLSPDVLDQGDVPVANDFRHPLAEIVRVRLGNHDVATVFPGFRAHPFGLARTP